ASAAQRGLFDKSRLKALIPTAGGPNALCAGRLAAPLVRGEAGALTLLYVQSSEVSLLRRAWQLFKPDLAGRNLQEHLDLIRSYAEHWKARIDVRKITESDTTTSILKEAAHGVDLLLIGAG